MKIAFYDTKPYDRTWFEPLAKEYGYKIKFFEHKLNADTAILAKGYNVVCAFVNDDLSEGIINILHENGIKLIAMRCAGYNNVDISAAEGKIKIVRVPSYSPQAVAEHTAALLLSVNRKTHRAYVRTRDNNFNINGLMGIDLKDKTAGIIGTGKIGRLVINILKAFDMRVIAYDAYPDKNLDVEYVKLDQLFTDSHVISLHCPLNDDTYHLVNSERINLMQDGAIIINTSRGALIDTQALIEGILSQKIGGAGLDVYEEESEYFFEDKSNEIIQNQELARLLSFPNVLVTSHQAFFTKEAMQAIAMTTMENIYAFANDKELVNRVCTSCQN